MGVDISRYRKRIQKEFEVEVVTPMFMGSANINEAELRTPSLKGMLRFWWRATCGIGDIQELKKRESEIFGDTSQKALFSVFIENFGNVQGVLKNLPKGSLFEVKSSRGTFTLGIIDYLAYGLRDQRRDYLRQHYPAGSKFKVKFMFSNEGHETEVLNAFKSLVHLGGLGARSRNGFGCLTLNDESTPSIVLDGKLKTFSSTSGDSDLFLTKKTNFAKWEDALSAIGMAYKDARLSLEPRHTWNKRLLIAKPIVQAGGNQKERHAKPYYLHVGKTPAGYYGQILYLPYQYMGGQGSHSERTFREYQEAGKTMNRIIKEKLSGGAK